MAIKLACSSDTHHGHYSSQKLAINRGYHAFVRAGNRGMSEMSAAVCSSGACRLKVNGAMSEVLIIFMLAVRIHHFSSI